MVKLTVDLIEGAGQYINPIRDRELDLRWAAGSCSQLEGAIFATLASFARIVSKLLLPLAFLGHSFVSRRPNLRSVGNVSWWHDAALLRS